MSPVKRRCRGGTAHHLVRGELVRAARCRGLTAYRAVATTVGPASRDDLMGGEPGRILRQTSEDGVQAGKPMPCSVAVGGYGGAGAGFLGLARALPRPKRRGQDRDPRA